MSLSSTLQAYENDFERCAQHSPTGESQRVLAAHFRKLRAYIADVPHLWLPLSTLFIEQMAVMAASKAVRGSAGWHEARERHSKTLRALQEACHATIARAATGQAMTVPDEPWEPLSDLAAACRQLRRPDAIPAIRLFVLSPPIGRGKIEQALKSTTLKLELVGEATELPQMAARLARRPADIAFVDLQACELHDLLARIEGGLAARVVLIHHEADSAWLDGAVLRGVRGIVRADDLAAVALDVIERVRGGGIWLADGAAGRVFVHLARQACLEGGPPVQITLKNHVEWLPARRLASLSGTQDAPGCA